MLVTVVATLTALLTACGNKGDLFLIEKEDLLPVTVVEDLESGDASEQELDEEALAERRRREAAATDAPDAPGVLDEQGQPVQQNAPGTN